MMSILIPVIVLVAVFVGVITPKITHKADTFPEEVAEDIIYMTTGKVIDFSEDLKEPKAPCDKPCDKKAG